MSFGSECLLVPIVRLQEPQDPVLRCLETRVLTQTQSPLLYLSDSDMCPFLALVYDPLVQLSLQLEIPRLAITFFIAEFSSPPSDAFRV